jgi:predicted amino acid racemase
MTKQHARNPELFRRVVKQGAKETVAVNMECARLLHRHGIGIGHMGNLVQVPKYELEKVVNTYRPEVISVFTLEKARQISDVCVKYGKSQKLLLRVHSDEDVLFPGMEGGFLLDSLRDAAAEIERMPGVSVEGVSTFPAVRYDADGLKPEATPNLYALAEAKNILRSAGIECRQVNAPGNNCCATMAFLAEHGATHAEPGSALTGSNTFHLFTDSEPESPAMVYLTEVSHTWAGNVYVYGEGFFMDDPPVSISKDFRHKAFFGGDPQTIMERELEWIGTGSRLGGGFAKIDYHGILRRGRPAGTCGRQCGVRFQGPAFYGQVVYGGGGRHVRGLPAAGRSMGLGRAPRGRGHGVKIRRRQRSAKMKVTFEDIKNSDRIMKLVNKANENLGIIGYTDHGIRHVQYIAKIAGRYWRSWAIRGNVWSLPR